MYLKVSMDVWWKLSVIKATLTSSVFSLFTSMFSVIGSMIESAVSSSMPKMHENISQLFKLHDSDFSKFIGLYVMTVVLYNGNGKIQLSYMIMLD